MMELRNIKNRVFQYSSSNVISTPRRGCIDICIRFYRAKFHLLGIPVIIILAAIHLKYAIQYLGQCPIQPKINIYMIVHAATILLVMVISLIGVMDVHCIYFRTENYYKEMIARYLILVVVFVTVILFLFSLSWLVAGSVWIFGAKTNGVQGSDPTATTTYCQSELYRAAFVLIILNYIFHIFIITLFVCGSICWKIRDTVPLIGAVINRV
jgi:hypothetical protein